MMTSHSNGYRIAPNIQKRLTQMNPLKIWMDADGPSSNTGLVSIFLAREHGQKYPWKDKESGPLQDGVWWCLHKNHVILELTIRIPSTWSTENFGLRLYIHGANGPLQTLQLSIEQKLFLFL